MNLYLVFNISRHAATIADNSSAAWAWVTNLGNAIFEEIKFKVNSGSNYLDILTTDTLNIESQLEISQERKIAYDKMIGNDPELCEMQDTHEAFQLAIPLNFFFSYAPSVAFPSISIQN